MEKKTVKSVLDTSISGETAHLENAENRKYKFSINSDTKRNYT